MSNTLNVIAPTMLVEVMLMPKKSKRPELCVRREYTNERDLNELVTDAYRAYFEDMIRLKSSVDTFAYSETVDYNGVNETLKEVNGNGSAT